MRIVGLHKNIYKLANYSLRAENKEKYYNLYEEPVRRWNKLKAEGVSDQLAAEFCGISRATYFRYRRAVLNLQKNIYPPTKAPKRKRQGGFGESIQQLILSIRRDNPTYGKNKIAVILKRDHQVKISESSVGRILDQLMQRGLIQPSLSAPKHRRKRRFKGHAKAWSYKLKPRKPGEMVQIDHMSVTPNQCHVKHFQAWDPALPNNYRQDYKIML